MLIPWWFLPSSCNKLGSCFWNPWQRQTFTKISHTTNFMVLLISNGCSSTKKSLTTLICFGSNNALTINIFNNWGHHGCLCHVEVMTIISAWHMIYQTKWGKYIQNFLAPILFHCIRPLTEWAWPQCYVLGKLMWEVRYKEIYLWISKKLGKSSEF